MQEKIHNPDTPFFFRNFVEALFRLFYLRCKFNLLQATKSFESAVSDHLLPMMQKRKQAKPIFLDESVFEEKLSIFQSELSQVEASLSSFRKMSKRPGNFLTLDDCLGLLRVIKSNPGIRLRHRTTLADIR